MWWTAIGLILFALLMLFVAAFSAARGAKPTPAVGAVDRRTRGALLRSGWGPARFPVSTGSVVASSWCPD
jgi:hypothetical protein